MDRLSASCQASSFSSAQPQSVRATRPNGHLLLPWRRIKHSFELPICVIFLTSDDRQRADGHHGREGVRCGYQQLRGCGWRRAKLTDNRCGLLMSTSHSILNVDRLANKQLLLPRQVARSITIRPGLEGEGNRVSEVPQCITIPRSKRTKPRSGPRDM